MNLKFPSSIAQLLFAAAGGEFEVHEGRCRSSTVYRGSVKSGEFDLYKGVSHEDCKSTCLDSSACFGYEYHEDPSGYNDARCEIWKVSIGKSQPEDKIAGTSCNIKKAAKFPPEGKEFQRAGYDDIRSPCPAINTIANHGFINRNGKNIDVKDLAQALEDVYRVSATLLTNGPIRSAIDFDLTEKRNGKDVLTIDQLFQNRDSTDARNPNRKVGTEAQEHDSSFIREDSDLPNDYAPSKRLLHDFFDANSGATLNPAEVMSFQRKRVKESCTRHEKDQTVRPYTAGQRGGMAIQGALMFVIGQAQRGPNSDVVSFHLHYIVESEKLPDGYDPDVNVLFTFADGCDSDNLRDAFLANVNQAICDFCPADDTFPCDNLEKVPVIKLPLGGTC